MFIHLYWPLASQLFNSSVSFAVSILSSLCSPLMQTSTSPSTSWGSLRGHVPWTSPKGSSVLNGLFPAGPEKRSREPLWKKPPGEIIQSPKHHRDRSAPLETLLESTFPECLTSWYSHVWAKTPSPTRADGFLLPCLASTCANYHGTTIVWKTPYPIGLFKCQILRCLHPSWRITKVPTLH